MSKDKKKKEKVCYIDDGRSLADLSDLSKRRPADRNGLRQPPKFRDCARTYWESVKLMLLPCLFTLAIIGLAFLIFWLAAG